MTQHGITLKRLHEFTRFIIVGTASALLNTAIIIVLTEALNLHYLLSYLLCFIGVTFFGFMLNRGWSFQVRQDVHQGEINRYFLVTLITTAFAIGVSTILVACSLPYPIAVFLSSALMAPLNFVFHRGFSFGLKGMK